MVPLTIVCVLGGPVDEDGAPQAHLALRLDQALGEGRRLAAAGIPVVQREDDKEVAAGGDGVTLSTIHSAKGWQCRVVYAVRLHYDTSKVDARQPALGWNIFCRGGDSATEEAKLEKVRLLFVAMSRAKRAPDASNARARATPTRARRRGRRPTPREPNANASR